MAKKATSVSIGKPILNDALQFATQGHKTASEETLEGGQGVGSSEAGKQLKTASKTASGLVPVGDVRLTANISDKHHLKLKIAAAQQRTTIGELIEKLIDKM